MFSSISLEYVGNHEAERNWQDSINGCGVSGLMGWYTRNLTSAFYPLWCELSVAWLWPVFTAMEFTPGLYGHKETGPTIG